MFSISDTLSFFLFLHFLSASLFFSLLIFSFSSSVKLEVARLTCKKALGSVSGVGGVPGLLCVGLLGTTFPSTLMLKPGMSGMRVSHPLGTGDSPPSEDPLTEAASILLTSPSRNWRLEARKSSPRAASSKSKLLGDILGDGVEIAGAGRRLCSLGATGNFWWLG